MRILIIRPSSIGDVVMASPVLKALKNGYKGAEIHWLINPALIDLLRDNPYVDSLIPWNKALWNRQIKEFHLIRLCSEIMSFKKNLSRHQYDLCLDLQGLFRSRFLAYLSRAKERIGFDSKEPGRFFMTKVISKGPQNLEMSSEYLYMLKELGIKVEDPLPFLVVPNVSKERAKSIIDAHGIKGPFFVFAPFTTRPQKHWIDDRWKSLGMKLAKHYGIPSVILGGRGDKQKGDAISNGTGNLIYNLSGKTNLVESAAIVSMAKLVIGVDTGLTHMGTAFKRPTVALFGATRPYLYTKWPKTKVLYVKRECSPCKRSPTCNQAFPCMSDITVNMVLKTVEGII
ncbi:glycosyltransferase family 9 protein [Dissulfuribacter thermophilus]|nr:glycosyltransferase family 9 protein [Dissulfuribacter thermophilus]